MTVDRIFFTYLKHPTEVDVVLTCLSALYVSNTDTFLFSDDMQTIGNRLKHNSLIEISQIILENAIIVHFVAIEELKTQSLYFMRLSRCKFCRSSLIFLKNTQC